MAPVARFAVLERRGREEEEEDDDDEDGDRMFCGAPPLPLDMVGAGTVLAGASRLLLATFSRSAFSVVKYSADPRPVRMTLGSVPRHRCWMAFGPAVMERRVSRREVERDCWTRVLRRSAGWRRKAERTPVERPARKWKVVGGRRVVLVAVAAVPALFGERAGAVAVAEGGSGTPLGMLYSAAEGGGGFAVEHKRTIDLVRTF